MINKHTIQKLAWRKRNPAKRRAQRQRHYDKTKVVADIKKRRPTGVPHRPWTHAQEFLVLHSPLTDRELAVILNRSCHAIQQRRFTLTIEMEKIRHC